MTSTSSSEKTQAQSASIPSANSPCDDSCHIPFDTLHHDSQHSPFSGLPHHPDTNDGAGYPPRSSTQPKAEVNFWKDVQISHTYGVPPYTLTTSFHDRFSCLEASITVGICNPNFTLARPCTTLSTESIVAHVSIFNLPMNDLLAELALRYWQDHDNLYIWAPIPIYTDRTDYRSLEMALIQEWQPRLNYPFICQFFHPKKGILKKPNLNTNAQFGLATLWRRAKHKFTPTLVRQILTSARFQNRLELSTIIHALGSNTKARFEQTKMLRSNDGGLTLCYALRRLANNIQEPFRTLSLNAIDASIKWWHGKPAPRASALSAPWSLTPNLQQKLKKFLRQWHLQMLDYQVPCHNPSFKMVFIKHAAVLDQLCNHKKAIDDWSTSNTAVCCCKHWASYKSAALNPSDPHWVLAGSLLHSLLPPELAVIAEGSLSNKVFPSKKEYYNQMRLGIKNWTKRNGLPSMPHSNISDLCHHLWSEHTQQITNHITKSSITQLQTTCDGAIFHCEDKQSSSLRIYCPCLYYQSIEQTFQDPSIFEQLPDEPTSIVTSLVDTLQRQHGRAYPALGSRIWQTTSVRLHSGQKEERLSKWQTRHFLCGLTFPSYAQYPHSSDFPAHPCCLSKSLCNRRCIHTPVHFEIGACRRRFSLGQSRPCGLLHQHRSR